MGFAIYAINKVPDGYSASDVCWSADGKPDQGGDQNLIEVPCSLDHDYVSGKTVDSEEDCPGKNGYLDNGDGTFVCLDDPHQPPTTSPIHSERERVTTTVIAPPPA